MKPTTVATFKDQLRQLYVDYRQVTKEHFGANHEIVNAAKDLFEMALIDCKRNEDSYQAKKLKAELAKVKEESARLKIAHEKLLAVAKLSNHKQFKAANEVVNLKQELQTLKKQHQTSMKAQKAKYEHLRKTCKKENATLKRLFFEAKTKSDKLEAHIKSFDAPTRHLFQLQSENNEVKEEVEKLTKEKDQLKEDLETRKFELTKTKLVHKRQIDLMKADLEELKALNKKLKDSDKTLKVENMELSNELKLKSDMDDLFLWSLKNI